MNKKIIFSSFFCFYFAVTAFASLPQWAKTEKNATYPEDTFVTAVGKGKTLKDADISAQRRITEKVNTNILTSDKNEKSDLSVRFLKYFERPLSYNDAADKTYYVFAIADKNSVRIDIENEIYLIQRQIMQKIAILETSVAGITAKINEIDSILALFGREDYFNSLKNLLKAESVTYSQDESFEREKLGIQKKELYSKINYYIGSEEINTPKTQAIFADNGVVLLSKLPPAPVAGKAFVTINCKTQIIKTESQEGYKYDWITDVSVNDSFDERISIYSNTSAGSESSPVESAAKEKARLSAEAEIYDTLEKFIKSTL